MPHRFLRDSHYISTAWGGCVWQDEDAGFSRREAGQLHRYPKCVLLQKFSTGNIVLIFKTHHVTCANYYKSVISSTLPGRGGRTVPETVDYPTRLCPSCVSFGLQLPLHLGLISP